jgi:hypothetical protein
MFDHTPENATRWRDLVDQLIPEQVARLEAGLNGVRTR